MMAPWKLLCGSTAGTSHERRGDGCQSYAHGVPLAIGNSSVLVAGLRGWSRKCPREQLSGLGSPASVLSIWHPRLCGTGYFSFRTLTSSFPTWLE